jgi:hypothetical protein
MRDQSFHTTTTAEFRELAEAARASGRLPELIKAISDRLERYRALLQTHQEARDFQSVQQTKRLIINLESKLQLALELQDANP